MEWAILVFAAVVLAYDSWAYHVLRKTRREWEFNYVAFKIEKAKAELLRHKVWCLENDIRFARGQKPLPPLDPDIGEPELIREGEIPKEYR